MDKRPVMVTIRCLAYNHEPYIKQCLDGFIMQKTNFRFEAIVHDDASTDGTADIIREYAEKYPDIIKPIIEVENQYSKKDGSLVRIMNEHTRGKYCASCEADDYWTDPLKLQKQVDFMDANPEYTMCFHSAIEHYEHKDIPDKLFSKISDKDYTGKFMFKNWIVPTASVLFRRSVLQSELYQRVLQCKDFIYGDTPLFVTCAELGKVRGMSDVMSVYRRNEGGVTFRDAVVFNDRYISHIKAFETVFGSEYKDVYSVANVYTIGSVRELMKFNCRGAFRLCRQNPYKIMSIWCLLRALLNYIGNVYRSLVPQRFFDKPL